MSKIRAYLRTSKIENSLARQYELLKGYNIDEFYAEQITGTIKERPELKRLLEESEEGDTIIVESLSRLGRKTIHLLELMEELKERKIKFISLKEKIDDSPTGQLILSMLSSISQFERDQLSERICESLQARKNMGLSTGRPPLNEEVLKKSYALYKSRIYSVREICNLCKISKTSLYRYIEQQNFEKLNKPQKPRKREL